MSHPQRREGRGKALLQASLNKLDRVRATVALAQIHAGNTASLSLFRGLGFRQIESLEDWLDFGRRSGFVDFRDIAPELMETTDREQVLHEFWKNRIAVINLRR